jgi:hypothetical protein
MGYILWGWGSDGTAFYTDCALGREREREIYYLLYWYVV